MTVNEPENAPMPGPKHDPKAEPKNESQSDVSPLALAGLGTQFAVALIVFAYAGQWLDKRYHSSPMFLLIGVFVGGGGSFFLGVKRLLQGSAKRNEGQSKETKSKGEQP